MVKREATAGMRVNRLCSPMVSSRFLERGFSFILSATPAMPSSFSYSKNMNSIKLRATTGQQKLLEQQQGQQQSNKNDKLPNQSINQLPNQSINQLPNQSINQLPNQSINQLSNQPINQLSNKSINQLSNKSINQLSDQSINQLSDQSMKKPTQSNSQHNQ